MNAFGDDLLRRSLVLMMSPRQCYNMVLITLNLLFLLDITPLYVYNAINAFELNLMLINHMIIQIQCVSTKC